MSSPAPPRTAVNPLTTGRELSMTSGGLILSEVRSSPSGLEGESEAVSRRK
ncbi:MAG: hypothetical protein H6P95_2730 [Candidatus Aminicenantes bacterium]|nr:hypothetical protein [Candidatus Aminicenantes bacterium]